MNAEKMPFQKWIDITNNHTAFEVWNCGRAMNQREPILVYITKGRRYRADLRQKCTKESLEQDGWTLYHRMNESVTG